MNPEKMGRNSLVENIREKFSPNVSLIAHFMESFYGYKGGTYDFMPVVVLGMNTEKLLGISKLQSGTGLMMGNAAVQLLQDWDKIPEFLAGLCFDTTSANTGIHTGAITIIQKAFGKNACSSWPVDITYLKSLLQPYLTYSVSPGPQIASLVDLKSTGPLLTLVTMRQLTRILLADEKQWLEQNRIKRFNPTRIT